MPTPFVEFPEGTGQDFVSFERPKYLRFVEGTPLIVRILDKVAYGANKHWIKRANASVLCLGEACPICKNNELLREQQSDSFKKAKGYIGISRRYLVNVLDRTPVLKDSETDVEYYPSKGRFPTVDPSGEKSLVGLNPEPSNTIKVLERGKELFEQLKMIHNETLNISMDADGQEVIEGGLTSFDIKLITMGSGKEMAISVMPLLLNNDDVNPILDASGLEPHILSSLGIELTPDEMIDLTHGVSLKDIFAKRRAESEITDVTNEVQGSLADVSERVSMLYGDSE